MAKYIKKGNNGGVRPGSGRKKGKVSPRKIAELEAKSYLVGEVLKDWIPIIEAKKMLALGEFKVDNGIKVYTAAPNDKALTDLIEMVVGKTPNKIEHDGKIDSPQVADSMSELANAVKQILSPVKQVAATTSQEIKK